MSLRSSRPARHGGRRPRGQGLIEFALVIPIFLLLLVALFDLGRAVFAYNTLTNAAREGARMAIVNQYTAEHHRPREEPDADRRARRPERQRRLLAGRLDDGNAGQDEAAMQLARRGRLPRRRQVRGDLPPDHAVHQQHPVRQRRDVHRDVAALGRVQLSRNLNAARSRPTPQPARSSHEPAVGPPPTHEVTMHRTARSRARRAGSAARSSSSPRSTMIALIGGVSLVLEGGNAYAHQRIAQNAADSVANAGRDRPRPATRRWHRRPTPTSSPRPTPWPTPTASTRTRPTTPT